MTAESARPKLLIVTTIPTTLRAFLLPFADHFRALGWRVDALAQGGSACGVCRPHFDQVHDATWSRDPLDPHNVLVAPGQLRELVRRERYDLVHVHTPIAAFVTRWALRGLRGPGGPRIVYTAHGFHFHAHGNTLKNHAFHTLERLAAGWTDRLVVINPEDEGSAQRLLTPRQVVHMPGIGVDVAAYAPPSAEERSALRASLGVGDAQPLFVMVAELIPRKRHDDALQAFASLDAPDAVLALASQGPLEAVLRERAAALGIADRVRFLGWRDDIPVLMGSADAVLLVSAQEGLPRSVMEAMAIGVPVIGTDIRGTRDLLGGGCGQLVPAGEPAGIARAMRRVIDDPAGVQAMAARARAAVEACDIRKVLAMHEALYAELLAAPL